MPLPEFTIKHFAGKVSYQVHLNYLSWTSNILIIPSISGGIDQTFCDWKHASQVHKFLDKNYDQVRQDVLDLFIQSKNKVREII